MTARTRQLAKRISDMYSISVTQASRIIGMIAADLEHSKPMGNWSGWESAAARLRAEAREGLLEPIEEERKMSTIMMLAISAGLIALFVALLVFVS